MGVPSFYRWLVDKYPSVVVKAIEEKGENVDSSLKNPNGIEFDNLYLDMNGIIHPCFHPEDHPSPPATFQEVFDNIYAYIDRLFAIVRPRKLLYMAIDGVAPRAKMNQQRSRRFRTAKDNEMAEVEESRLRRQFEMEGKQLFLKQESEVSDSNIITPGTAFLHELSKSLQSYIYQHLINDAGWKDVKVILSDANVPGEGEHKIMSFIRLQRASPGYNANTRHCIYGLDADLIMLALATHEVHFSILREDVLIQEQQTDFQFSLDAALSKAEQTSLRCRGGFKQAHSLDGNISSQTSSFKQARSNAKLVKTPYQFLHVWILREYLELDLKIVDPPDNIKLDFERQIDDFIFICFFTGNDFLPHMPTLEIHEGAINLLLHVYKQEFKKLGGHLIDMQWAGDKNASYIKLKRVEKFILSVGAYEERIFKKRSEIRERRLRRLMSTNNVEEEQEEETGPEMELSHCALGSVKAQTSIQENMEELKKKLKACIRDRSDLFKNGSIPLDKVKLASVGWRERYYKEKFAAEIKEDMERTRKEVVQKYTEGLCWVLLYYFSEVPSWTWFYPYHYGPFASDLRGLSQVTVKFQKGSPFKPFDQLMGVLPPRSAHALPRAYQRLMQSEESDLLDLYPSDFEHDAEGKRFMWQAISKLPFIDEERLLSATRKLEVELQDDEVERNTTKVDVLYMSSNQELRCKVGSLFEKHHEGRQADMVKHHIDTDWSCGISGFISPLEEFTIDFVESDPREDQRECQENSILCVRYENPDGSQHIPRALEGVRFPQKTLSEADIVETQLWHECHGNNPSHTRSQIQYSHRKPTDVGCSSSAKSPLGDIHKGAGSGWGCGRGKPENNSSEYYARIECTKGGRGGKFTASSSSSGTEVRGPSLSRNSSVQNAYRGTYNTVETWKSSTFARFEPRALENMRISDSQQGFNYRGRGAPRGRSTNYMRYGTVEARSVEWRRIVQPSAVPSSWQHNRPRVDDRNYNWGQNVQPYAAPSGQHADIRSQYTTRSTTNAWRQHQSPAAAAPFSMPGHGRGRFEPKTTGTSPTENFPGSDS